MTGGAPRRVSKLEQDFAAVGVEIVYFPYTVHTSSTQLRRALDVLSRAEAGFATDPRLNAELRSVPGTTS